MTSAESGSTPHSAFDHYLSAKEAADYLGISLKRLYAFCNDGSLRHLRLADTSAGVLRFRKVWLDTWAEAKATGGTPLPKTDTRAVPDAEQRFWVSDYYPAITIRSQQPTPSRRHSPLQPCSCRRTSSVR